MFRCFGCCCAAQCFSERGEKGAVRSGWLFRSFRNSAFRKHRNTKLQSGTGLQKQKDSCLLIMVPSWRPIKSVYSLSVATSPGVTYPQDSAVSIQWWVSCNSPSESVSFDRK